MKKRVLTAILALISLMALTSCMQRLQNEGGSSAVPTAEPTQTESEKKGEHIDENQGERDTEDTPTLSTETSASDTQNSEEPTADHETHHDENEGEWDVE